MRAIGPHSVTCEATQLGSGVRGLLKFLRLPEGVSRAERQRIAHEVQRRAPLRTPYLSEVFSAGLLQDTPYVLRAEILGESLCDRLMRRGPLTPSDALIVGIQIARGLEELHRAGLLHRDLNPTHAILKDGHLDHLTLVDAGLPGRVETPSGELVQGSAAYLSPEQVSGRPAGMRSDLYALGCILFEMLTGEPPYVGEDIEVLKAHVAAPIPDLPPGTPAGLVDITRQLLAKDAMARAHSTEQVRRELESLLQQLGQFVPARASRVAEEKQLMDDSRQSGTPVGADTQQEVAARPRPPAPPGANAKPPAPPGVKAASAPRPPAPPGAPRPPAPPGSARSMPPAPPAAPIAMAASVDGTLVPPASPASSDALSIVNPPLPTLTPQKASATPSIAPPPPPGVGASMLPPPPPIEASPAVTSLEDEKTRELGALNEAEADAILGASSEPEELEVWDELLTTSGDQKIDELPSLASITPEAADALLSEEEPLPTLNFDAVPASSEHHGVGDDDVTRIQPFAELEGIEHVTGGVQVGETPALEPAAASPAAVPGLSSLPTAASSLAPKAPAPKGAALDLGGLPTAKPGAGISLAGLAPEVGASTPVSGSRAAGRPSPFEPRPSRPAATTMPRVAPEREVLSAVAQSAPSPATEEDSELHIVPSLPQTRARSAVPLIGAALAGAAAMGLVVLFAVGGSDEPQVSVAREAVTAAPQIEEAPLLNDAPTADEARVEAEVDLVREATQVAPTAAPAVEEVAAEQVEAEPADAVAADIAEAPVDEAAPEAVDVEAAGDESDVEAAGDEPEVQAAQEAPRAVAKAERSRKRSRARARARAPRRETSSAASSSASGSDLDQARAHYRARRFREAAQAYERATAAEPRNAGAFAGLGASRMQARDASGAVAAYQRAVALQPGNAAFAAALGHAYRAMGDTNRARQAYQRALTLNPNHSGARLALQGL